MDPRRSTQAARTKARSALLKLQEEEGPGANVCPYGCEDDDVDENGYCGHLIGFTNGGGTYEPRVRQPDGRIVVIGSQKKPMKQGMKMVKISTSARVYSPKLNKDLVTSARDYEDEDQRAIADREREMQAALEELRNPQLDGFWGESIAEEETVYSDGSDGDDADEMTVYSASPSDGKAESLLKGKARRKSRRSPDE